MHLLPPDDLLLRLTPLAIRQIDLCSEVWRRALERPLGRRCPACHEHYLRYAFEPSVYTFEGRRYRTNVVARPGACRCAERGKGTLMLGGNLLRE